MLDFDWSKFLLLGIVALVFIPARDLPRVLRQVGQFVGKMRRMASEFQGQFMDAIKEADMHTLREDLAKIGDSAKFDVNLNASPSISSAPVTPVTSVDLPPMPEVPTPVLTAAPATKPRIKAKAEFPGDTPPKKAAARKRTAKTPTPADNSV